jgi:hypothetical protein
MMMFEEKMSYAIRYCCICSISSEFYHHINDSCVEEKFLHSISFPFSYTFCKMFAVEGTYAICRQTACNNQEVIESYIIT